MDDVDWEAVLSARLHEAVEATKTCPPDLPTTAWDRWGEQCLMPGLDLSANQAEGLDPADCKWSDAACETVGQVLGDRGAAELAAVLATGDCRMQGLVAPAMSIGPNGAAALSAPIGAGQVHLLGMALNDNELGDDGAEAIASAIHSEKSSLR